MHPSDNNDFSAIEKSLRRLSRKLILMKLLIAAAMTAVACFGLLTLVQLVFAVFPWSLLPLLWDAVVAIFVTIILWLILDKCFLHRPPLLQIAAILEERFQLKPRWLTLALELRSPTALGSDALKNDVMATTRQCLERYPFGIPIQLPRSITMALLATAAAWGITTMSIRPRCAAFWDLPLSFRTSVSGSVFPGTITLPLYASIDLRCVPRGGAYPSCRLSMTGRDNVTQSYLLRPDPVGSFCLHCDKLTGSFTYQFSISASAFPAETVRVAPKPSIYSMRIRVTPPAYVGLPAALLQEGQGNFSVFAGSTARFSLAASGGLARAAFCFSDGDTVPFAIKGNEASGEVKLLRPCSYTFSLIDTFGQKSDSLPSFFIDRIADRPPLVHFLKPGMNKELTPALAETLWIEALDDIGIKECSFDWRKNTEPQDTAHVQDLITGNRPQTEIRRQMVWDVRELSLYPGDTLFYWAYVRDNDPYDKTHFSVSETYWLRLPTFEEIHERLTRQQNTTEQSLESAQEKQDMLRSTLSNLLKSTKGKESLTWEQKQIVNDLKESLKAQSDTLNKAVEALKQTVEQLKENGLSSKDIIDKMDKVRKALEELARDYGDSLLFDQPKQNESVGMQELKESLEKFRKMLPDLAKRLENALKYLDMLKRDRQLADLAERAEKYGKEQIDLAAQSPKMSPRIERQKELTKKIEDLLSDVARQSDTGNQAPLFSKEEVPSLQQALSQLQTMKNGFLEPSAQEDAVERMSAGLFSLAQNLRDLQSNAMAAKLKKEKEALMEMSHDALNMAQWQEEMANENLQFPHAPGKAAQTQQALKQALLKSADNLNKLSMTPPQILRQLMKQFDDAGAGMDKSIDALKNEMNALDAMKAAEGGLNGLAFSLLGAAGAMDGEGQANGGMGEMMGGFQRLSGKQAMINSATGQILRQMLGEGYDGQRAGEGGEGKSTEQTEKARKEAQQAQQAIADELKKLADSYGKEAGNGLDKKARELEEEARKLARMLENPKSEIQDRQQRFLSRMLQTTLSMHKQDEGKEKRQSQSAKNIFSENIQKTAPSEFSDRDAFFLMRQKAFSGNFPENYRFSIKQYFDSLGVLFLKEK